MADNPPVAPRIASLDQFRGYTVLGMFLVNFVGSYTAIKAVLPILCHHHTYCSYADTIMPQFFLAVGFAYRLTFLRRLAQLGERGAYLQILKRNFGLILLGFVIHHLDGKFEVWADLQKLGFWGFLKTGFQRNFFQTLTHIGVTSLWIMPVIAARPAWRVAYAVLSAVLFHLLSRHGYYEWVLARPGIDGGPLGFLTWTIPMIVGTLACDAMADGKRPVGRLLAGGVLLMLLAYGLACLNHVTPPNSLSAAAGWKAWLVEPPFVAPSLPVDIWTMSQRAGSVTYLTFGAGFSLALYALFVAACDLPPLPKGGQGGFLQLGPLRVGIFRTLGTNALAGYVIHELVNDAVEPFVPKDSPLWYVFAGFGVSLLICYAFLRYLEKQRLFFRL